MSVNASYDYIIIGAGAAGCVIADRLSKAGATVLLLEAGGQAINPAIDNPGGFVSLWGSEPGLGFGNRATAGHGRA